MRRGSWRASAGVCCRRRTPAPVPVAFVSGHLDLTEDEFVAHYGPQIEAVRASGGRFVVGDARGADLLFQRHAHRLGLDVTVYHMFEGPRHNAGDVTVYHMFEGPRHNAGEFPTIGGFTSDEVRDAAMTAASSLDIAWVRPGRERSGTAKNLRRRARAAG